MASCEGTCDGTGKACTIACNTEPICGGVASCSSTPIAADNNGAAAGGVGADNTGVATGGTDPTCPVDGGDTAAGCVAAVPMGSDVIGGVIIDGAPDAAAGGADADKLVAGTGAATGTSTDTTARTGGAPGGI